MAKTVKFKTKLTQSTEGSGWHFLIVDKKIEAKFAGGFRPDACRWPRAARQQQLSGCCQMDLEISADGLMIRGDGVCSDPMFLEPTLRCLAAQEFIPARQNGQAVPDKQPMTLKVGDVVRLVTPGSGGMYPANERSRERIADDVMNHVISADKAKEDYGFVALNPTTVPSVTPKKRIKKGTKSVPSTSRLVET